MCAQTILILAEPEDEHGLHVMDTLRGRGAAVEVLDSRAFPASLRLTVDPHRFSGRVVLEDGRVLAFDRIQSVYWRNYSGVSVPETLAPDQLWIAENDARGLFESFLIQLPTRWVNGWEAFTLHQTKPVQLARVAALGIPIPATRLTNDPETLREFAAAHGRCILKPVQGGDHAMPLTDRHLTPENLEALKLAPVTIQEEIPGTNIRAFVAGERIYACEIRTDRLDYRDDDAPELLVHHLPPGIRDQCLRIARELHLRWTGIDFRRTPTGKYVFLEANPSPMFLGFEEQTGLPLTAALVDLLM